MEDPKNLLKNKDKEKINSSQFGASSSQYFHSIQESESETSVERLLLKSKSESDLKKVEINPSRLESYLLDSLWRNLQTPIKTKKNNLYCPKHSISYFPTYSESSIFSTFTTCSKYT